MQKKQPVTKVSIAMAVYNGGQYLQEQLDSFVQQSRMPDELVICDDGSADNTVDLAYEFAQQAPFEVKVCENPANLGYAQNFAKAVSLCSGDMVFLSDQDDVWSDDKLAVLLQFMQGNSACQVIMNDTLITDSNLSPSGHSKREQIFSAGLDDSDFVMGCCMGIERRFVEFALPIPNEYGAHDLWIAHLADALNVRTVLSDTLQFYRQHGENESDFYVNSTRKVSRLAYLTHRVKARFRQHRETILLAQKIRLRALSLRLQELLDSGKLSENEQQHALASIKPLQSKSQHIDLRLALITRSPFARVVPVFRLLANNGYSSSRGILSALGDILLP